MSESNTTDNKEQTNREFDSQAELVKFYLRNASMKHGVPWEPNGPIAIDTKTSSTSITSNSGGVVGTLLGAVKRHAIPVALAAALGGGALPLYAVSKGLSLFGDKSGDTQGSLIQYLEDGGFHRADG